MEFEPLHGEFGARVLGVDLTCSLTPGLVEMLHTAIDEYSVLLFPDQDMSDEAQLRLTEALGEIEESHVAFGQTGAIVNIATVGNVIDANTKRDESDSQTAALKGNNLWHSDSSFRRVPSYVSILHAYEVPAEGGHTEFVSQRAAYDRLTPAKQVAINDLHVLHDYVFSRSKTVQVNDNHAASLPPIEQKLVRSNPRNGRRNFYVGSHARSIIDPNGRDWSGMDSRKLIDDLNECATEPEARWVQQWTPGDTVFWDNRCVLHRGAGYNADRYRRNMRQTRVRGAGPTLDE
ncbi:MAG: alpha-ketoglutarate-dependent 2,4-dichlorophenoxyacetate dioxygenase [Candidatus Poriferisodalaceae bacterium]|jgi:alpha-ketoglutarate-dependent 2,4-dichlorophenoxyacetate dioxygenase